MNYQEITTRIASLEMDLKCATSNEERNYFKMELLVAEEILANGIERANGILAEMR
jgi:hypothetical protein